jgi:protein involved in sex pheromone biosynthesis
MRLIISTAAVLLLSACQVNKDDANDSVSVTYNEDVAENTVADVSNTAQDVAGDVANEVDQAGERLQNVDVDVDTNTQDGQ